MSWPESSEELLELQHQLAREHPAPWQPTANLAVGACAVVFPRGQRGPGARGDPAWAAAAVLSAREVLAEEHVICRAGGPYVPGLLALREGPCLEAAVRQLGSAPDVLLVDATARDHPRRAGMALHLGAVLGLPTVGVTHRPLLATGEWPEDKRGASAPLLLEGQQVGAWLRTRRGARPLAIHHGWRTELDTAIEAVLEATFWRRTPEPFRRARHLARTARTGAG